MKPNICKHIIKCQFFFVTARSETGRDQTYEELEDTKLHELLKREGDGGEEWKGRLKMRAKKDRRDVGKVKAERRAEISKTHKILHSVGDQDTDGEGGYTMGFTLLPNAAYQVR